VADLELALSRRGRLTAEINRSAAAAFEYGSVTQLPGVPLLL
jgi:hypothetical protein